MNPLKKLIATKQSSSVSVPDVNVESSADDKKTYYEEGYDSSKNANGNALIFTTCLDDVYQRFKDSCRRDEVEQQRLKDPILQDQERQRTELKKRETLKSIKEEELEKLETSIHKIDNDISEVKNDPERFGIDATKKPKAQFYIGLAILLPITLYLLVFYISASYSAFFKAFESSAVIAAIFDANALTKAFNDGWLEAVFVCTIPFAFMGLGYLVHMFQKDAKGGKLKIVGLFAVTFIFDAILAYQIEKKIYDFDKTLTSEPFNLSIAFQSVEFWGIIFAGFVVYIIWGLVFDFVMKEHENMDKIRVLINKFKEDKENLLKRKPTLVNAINDIKQDITHIQGEITRLQNELNSFIFPQRKYLLYHSEFVKGWYMAISNEIALPHDRKQDLLAECEVKNQEHLGKDQLLVTSSQNVILSNVLSN